MAKSTFTNEQLCRVWAKQAKAGGTRGDVVRELMEVTGMDNTKENHRKTYNNVTQRVKQLSSNETQPVTFPSLAAGKKGAKRSTEQMEALQALLNGEDENADTDDTNDEEVATSPDDVEDDVEDDDEDEEEEDNAEVAF